MRNPDIELQQRAIEYLQLTSIASTDVLATVLEEMPPFPERESSILAKLKKKKPGAMSVDEQNADGAGGAAGDDEVGQSLGFMCGSRSRGISTGKKKN